MSLDEVISIVANHESSIDERRVVDPLRMEGGATLVADGKQLSIDTTGLERLCQRFSAPASYLEHLDEDLRGRLLQWHIDQSSAAGERFTLITRGEEFLGFGQPDLLRLNGVEVLEAVQAGTPQELHSHSLQLSPDSVQADLLLVDLAEEVAPGDVLRAGMRITHSLIGEHAVWVESYIHRLVCSNGMVHRECGPRRAVRTRRLPAGKSDARAMQRDQVRRVTAEVIAALRPKLGAISKLRRSTVNVDQLFTTWLERARLSTRLWRPVVRIAWETEGGESTAYGVMNAFTRVATHERDLSVRQRRILSGLAGLLAFEDIHICPRCFSHLGGPTSDSPIEH